MRRRAAAPVLTAAQLIDLLATRHAKDVFIAECKNGGTWRPGADGALRLDAWVLRKTWSPWTTIGYEVKVSRTDFERDQKWAAYLSYCHQFSFVCPSGLIKAVDLPKGVGLIWCSANGGRLYTKVKAMRREPDQGKLAQLMSYALMSRSRVVADMHEAARDDEPDVDRLTMYRRWVEAADEKKMLASFVRGHIRRRVDAADKRDHRARRALEDVAGFTERLRGLGITWDADEQNWHHIHEVEREIDRLDRGLGRFTRRDLRAAATAMVRALDEVEQAGERQKGASHCGGASRGGCSSIR